MLTLLLIAIVITGQSWTIFIAVILMYNLMILCKQKKIINHI